MSSSCQPITGQICLLLVVLLGSVIRDVRSEPCDMEAHFTVEPDMVTPDINLFLAVCNGNVSENAPKGGTLYTLHWDQDFTVTMSGTDLRLDYSSPEEAFSSRSMVLKVPPEGISGIADFPEHKEKDFATCTFEDTDGKQCTVMLSTKFNDENTKNPEFDEPSYSVTLREDYPVSLPIATLKINVKDLDGSPPNNEFEVNFAKDCPLEVASLGADGDVTAQLKETLDYDSMANAVIECTLKATDLGKPPLPAEAKVLLTVEGIDDEPPVFSYSVYYAAVEYSSVDESSLPLTIQPEPIYAIDNDMPPSALTYTLKDAIQGVTGTDYFRIDSTTGEVFLQKDLDPEAYTTEFFVFTVTATEDLGSSSSAMLALQLSKPAQDGVIFDRTVYSADVTGVEVGKLVTVVRAISSDQELPILYSFADYSDHQDLFEIEETTGEILVGSQNLQLGTYHLEVHAEAGEYEDFAQVIVDVKLDIKCNTPMFLSALILEEVDEGAQPKDIVILSSTSKTSSFCIAGVTPSHMQDKFSLSEAGVLRTVEALDRDWAGSEDAVVRIKVQVDEGSSRASCGSRADVTEDLERNQAWVHVTIKDTNDSPPTFELEGEEVHVAYPVQPTLQSVVGAVVSLKASDKDQATNLKYQLEETDLPFAIDSKTGSVYARGELQCDTTCDLVATVSDGKKEDSINIKVHPLDMDHIFTLYLDDATVSEAEATLDDLSTKTSLKISPLYMSPSITASGASRDARLPVTRLEVHVYAIDNKNRLVSLDDLNIQLTEAKEEEATDFSDRNSFETPEVGSEGDVEGLTVAVGILGALLGIVLVAGVVLAILHRRRKTNTPPRTPSDTQIPTLGSIYSNEAFQFEDSTDNNGKKTSSLSKASLIQNGSLKGSGPPKQDLQKDVENGVITEKEPHYEPPPYIKLSSTNTNTNSTKTPLAGSSEKNSSPAPLGSLPRVQTPPKKRSDSPQPGKAVPAKSILKNKDAEGPLEGPKKPAEPATDYDDEAVPKGAFFGKLKASPPMRKSTNTAPPSGEDAKDAPVAVTPLGTPVPERKSNLKSSQAGAAAGAGGEGNAEDKTVAFKILVESVEIEAENPSPFVQEEDNAAAVEHLEQNAAKMKAEEEEEEVEVAKL